MAAVLMYLWLPWDLLPHVANYGNNVLLSLFVSGVPHGWRNRWIEKAFSSSDINRSWIPDSSGMTPDYDIRGQAIKEKSMPNVVETDIKTVQQIELLEAVFPKAKPVGLGEFDSRTIRFGFDTVRFDVSIGKPSFVDAEIMDEFKAFVEGAGEDLGRGLIVQRNWIPAFAGMTAQKKSIADIGDLEFNQALILARRDENFRRFVAQDIMNVVAQFIERSLTAPDESGNYGTTPDESGNYGTAMYEQILSEAALLRASGSSLFEELDKAADRDGTAGKGRGKDKAKQDYLKQDVRFLAQTAFIMGLFEELSGEKVIGALDDLFNKYYDEILRRALVFDAARQLIAIEALKTSGNYMVFDISELFDERVKDEQKARMIAMLSHLANILGEDKEALKGKIALVSNRKGINNENLLLELVQRYPGLNAVKDILENNLSRGNLVIKTSDSNRKIVAMVNGESKISLNYLVNSLGGRAVSGLELFTLSKKNIHDDLTAELKQNINMIIIDLMTDATAQLHEDLQKIRFVTIMA